MLYLVSQADGRKLSGSISDKADDCCCTLGLNAALPLNESVTGRRVSGSNSDKNDDCCTFPNGCGSTLVFSLLSSGARDASEPSTVGILYLVAEAGDRKLSGNISDKNDDCCCVF